MRKTALLACAGAALALAAGPAQAGLCSGQIMALQDKIERMPVTASRTNPAGGGPAPLTPPGAQVPAPGQTLGAAPSAESGGTAMAHAVPNGSGEAAGTSPTTGPLPDANGGVMAKDGSGTPPPAESAPMDSDESQAGEMKTEPGVDADAAAQALARARAFDQAGDEAACMNAIDQAKGALSPE